MHLTVSSALSELNVCDKWQWRAMRAMRNKLAAVFLFIFNWFDSVIVSRGSSVVCHVLRIDLHACMRKEYSMSHLYMRITSVCKFCVICNNTKLITPSLLLWQLLNTTSFQRSASVWGVGASSHKRHPLFLFPHRERERDVPGDGWVGAWEKNDASFATGSPILQSSPLAEVDFPLA